ncbi:MAG: M23 family metallopeptidase [Alphaproteobacteria bacterium]|nr:M23 family metallopeptidase [Alphaproteobacteria bacterium]
MPRSLAALLVLLLGVCAARAEVPLVLSGEARQGGLLIGRTSPAAEVELNGRRIRLAPDGRFVIGFGRDHPPQARLEIRLGQARLGRDLVVSQRSYDIQRIDGLPPAQVTPPPEVLERIRAEAARIQELRTRDSGLTGVLGGWVWPVNGPITGVYGSQRILNGEPRQPHFGIDIAAPTGTPVVAAADGEVVLAEADFYFTGGTVMIDHGHGVSSVYSHLSRVDVTAGRPVARGEHIGAVGATGRVTGAHLDFRVNWLNERIDPALVLGGGR